MIYGGSEGMDSRSRLTQNIRPIGSFYATMPPHFRDESGTDDDPALHAPGLPRARSRPPPSRNRRPGCAPCSQRARRPGFRPARAARGAAGRARRHLPASIRARFVERLLDAVPRIGPCRDRRRHDPVARLGRGGVARRRRRRRRGRCGRRRRGRQRVLRGASARPPCRARPGDGLLPVQQCRDRRAAGARGARPRRASR